MSAMWSTAGSAVDGPMTSPEGLTKDVVTAPADHSTSTPSPAEPAGTETVESIVCPCRGLLDEIDPQRSRVARFAEHRTSLDDVFAALTGPQAATPVMENAYA